MRVKAEHLASNLTPARRDALVALQALLCTGDTEPTDEEVAALTGCSARSVRRARADAREMGLLAWQRTRRRVAGAWPQGPNAYTPVLPTTPVSPRNASPPASQTVRASKEDKNRDSGRRGAIVVPANANEALAGIAARRAVQLGLASCRSFRQDKTQ